MKQQQTTFEYRQAMAANADQWVPACGGTEQPFDYNGTRYLYCFNPQKREHGYINLDTDILEPNPIFAN